MTWGMNKTDTKDLRKWNLQLISRHPYAASSTGAGAAFCTYFYDTQSAHHKSIQREHRQLHLFLIWALDRCMWSASHQGHLTHRKNSWYTLNRRQGHPQDQSGHFLDAKNFWALSGIKLQKQLNSSENQHVYHISTHDLPAVSK